MPLLSSEINVLEKVCNKASKIIIRDFGEIEKLQVSKKGPGDFVTKTDKKVEQIIIEELEKARPGFNILLKKVVQQKTKVNILGLLIRLMEQQFSCTAFPILQFLLD